MDDFKALVQILISVIACEENGMSMDFFSEKTLGISNAKRDRLAYKLYKEGLIEGLTTTDELNGIHQHVILWQVSHPEITIKGMEFLRENKAAKKIVEDLKKVAAGFATIAIKAVIANL